MRLLVTIVAKNEQNRFLTKSLQYLRSLVSEPGDSLFVFDDMSSDNTAQIARDLGAVVRVRHPCVPSWLEHEGACRQAAWDSLEELCKPDEQTAVLAIDADEVLVSNEPVREQLEWCFYNCLATECSGVVLPIPEIFGFSDDGRPLVRTDQHWGKITGLRLCPWRPDGKFADKPLACGSLPTYATMKPTKEGAGLHLLHLGYSCYADRVAKYERYRRRAHGHSLAHIESIVSEPGLVAWDGPPLPMQFRDRG